MKWEDLKVYHPLTKEELKPAFKDFTKTIADSLVDVGFELKGRKIQRIVNDVLQIIHIDTRGSWTGISEYYETEISVTPICNAYFTVGELCGTKRIEELVPGIRNNDRVTQEYKLLAEFMTRQIRGKVLGYLEEFNSTRKIIQNPGRFPISDMLQKNEPVIIFSELKNHLNKDAEKEMVKVLNRWDREGNSSEYLSDLRFFVQRVREEDWDSIDRKLHADEENVLRKLKLKRISAG